MAEVRKTGDEIHVTFRGNRESMSKLDAEDLLYKLDTALNSKEDFDSENPDHFDRESQGKVELDDDSARPDRR